MEIKNSLINIKDCFILSYTFKSIPSKDNEDINLYGCPVNIDFGLKNDDKSNLYVFFIKVWSNFDEEPLSGYSFHLETATFFSLVNEKKIDPNVKSSLLGNSIVGLAYANLRSILIHTSGMAPFGKYILPSIDLVDILKQKTKEENTKG